MNQIRLDGHRGATGRDMYRERETGMERESGRVERERGRVERESGRVERESGRVERESGRVAQTFWLLLSV